jgi:hypothetical protein
MRSSVLIWSILAAMMKSFTLRPPAAIQPLVSVSVQLIDQASSFW